MEFFDISRTLFEGMAVWPGDPEFSRTQSLSMEEGAASNVSLIALGSHTGTHVDAPLHLIRTGTDVALLPLSHFVGPARVLDLVGRKCILPGHLEGIDWQGVRRVLFKTCDHPSPDRLFDQNYTCLDQKAAEFLVGKGILLVGIDTPSVDPFDSTDLLAHKTLLSSGVVIVEGLALDLISPGDYWLACLPLKIAGSDGSPVRAVLWR